MKKIIYVIIALVVVGGAFYFLNAGNFQGGSSATAVKKSPPPQKPTNPLQVVIPTEAEKKARAEAERVAKEQAQAVEASSTQATSTSETLNDNDTSSVNSADLPSAITIDVSGKNFSFLPAEIKVKEGDTVTINFSSEEGTHNWTIDDFDASTETISTGGISSVTFTADKKGTFEYYCSVGTHRAKGMVGKLIVE